MRRGTSALGRRSHARCLRDNSAADEVGGGERPLRAYCYPDRRLLRYGEGFLHGAGNRPASIASSYGSVPALHAAVCAPKQAGAEEPAGGKAADFERYRDGVSDG